MNFNSICDFRSQKARISLALPTFAQRPPLHPRLHPANSVGALLAYSCFDESATQETCYKRKNTPSLFHPLPNPPFSSPSRTDMERFANPPPPPVPRRDPWLLYSPGELLRRTRVVYELSWVKFECPEFGQF